MKRKIGMELLDDHFRASGATDRPAAREANTCLRRTAAGLVADADPHRVALGQALSRATINTGATGPGSIVASVAVAGNKLSMIRTDLESLRMELAGQFAHDGWQLTELRVVAADPADGPPPPRTTPPKKSELASVLADAISRAIKSYDVADVCDRLGMPPHPDSEADPHRSKAVYVGSRLHAMDLDGVASAARRFLEDYDSSTLEELVDLLRRGNHHGTVKNLVFGSTSKPDLVLIDALSNDLGLVNSDEALIYDGGIPDGGLPWSRLVTGLLPDQAALDLRQASLSLYQRLTKCLASEAERNLFRVYAERYGALGFDEPALIPQVWLHYDPKAAWQRQGSPPLTRQRMDFLLLLARRRRVVIEVDGVQHYSENGHPSPRVYAETVVANRGLQLGGYEVYSFGGAELMDLGGTRAVARPFFDALIGLR